MVGWAMERCKSTLFARHISSKEFAIMIREERRQNFVKGLFTSREREKRNNIDL